MNLSTTLTRTITRDGLTYTAHFKDWGDAFRVTGFTIEAAGQVIDAMKDIPSGWTVEARDAEFTKRHPQLSMLADEVYEQGVEVFSETDRRAV